MGSVESKQYHIFISHSSQDRKWAEMACAELERRSIGCWIAPRDITPGTEWGAAIIDGIDHSRLMVLVFSANANESAQVRREVERAIGKAIPVLPLRIEDTLPKGAMELALSNMHWLDAFAPPAEDRLVLLAESVEALLGVNQAKAGPQPKNTSIANAKLPPTTPTAEPPTTSQVSNRAKRRVTWIAIGVLIAVVAILSAAFHDRVWRSTSLAGAIQSPPTDEPNESASAGDFLDETSSLQGRWLAIAESRPKGPMNRAEVARRSFSLTIRNGTAIHRRKPTESETIVTSGSISFRKKDDTQTFTFHSLDGTGKRSIWLGLYKFEDGVLQLCYREGGLARSRPESFSYFGERMTTYVKLRRQVGPRMN